MKAKDMNMYKKIILCVALLSVWTQYACDETAWFQVKPSYFFFTSSPMKHVYDHGGVQIQASASIPYCAYLDMYGSVGYRKVWGRACNTCEKTNLAVMPVDIGLKPIVTIGECFRYFFAIGPRYFHFHQRNHSPYVDCSIKSGGVGLFVNTGFNALLANCFLLGIFGEYSYEKKKICPTRPNVYSNGTVQIGGLAFGVSLGYAF